MREEALQNLEGLRRVHVRDGVADRPWVLVQFVVVATLEVFVPKEVDLVELFFRQVPKAIPGTVIDAVVDCMRVRESVCAHE